MQEIHHVQATGTDTTRFRSRARGSRSGGVPGLRLWRPGSLVRRLVTMVGSAAIATGTAVAVPVVVAAPAHAATTSAISVQVTSARAESHFPGGAVTQGQAVTDFRYMINVDNTGTGDPIGAPAPGTGCSPQDEGYPTSCPWASLQEVTGAPIYQQGTNLDFDGGDTLNLPDGRYLITVLADGYKIDGVHFTVPMEETEPGKAVLGVTVQPNPLVDATLRAQVFEDSASTNGAIDNGEAGRARAHRHRVPGSHQRHPRRGHDRRLRQPPVHDLPG